MSFNVNRRTGIPSLIQVSKVLCELLVHFSPIIRRLYPSNTALHAALAAAEAACAVLRDELEAQREIGV